MTLHVWDTEGKEARGALGSPSLTTKNSKNYHMQSYKGN